MCDINEKLIYDSRYMNIKQTKKQQIQCSHFTEEVTFKYNINYYPNDPRLHRRWPSNMKGVHQIGQMHKGLNLICLILQGAIRLF